MESHYLPRHSIVLGLTATPWRLSKKEWLGQRFDILVEGPQPPEIIKCQKALPCRGFTVGGVLDLDNLYIRNGDYIDAQIASQACNPEALAHVVNEWQRLAVGRPTLMIGATVEQARLTRNEFIKRGIAAELITGSTSQAERSAIFARVERGETQVITSVGCLTAGFNLPCIAAILYVRATQSKSLFFQSAGRGCRTDPGKQNYILIDFGRNLKRFGDPMGYQVYDISKPMEEDKPPVTKTCPSCGAEMTVFAQICLECGHEFTGQKKPPEIEDFSFAQLGEYLDRNTKIVVADLRRAKKQAYLDDVTPDRPLEQFVEKHGYTPLADWLHHACLTRRFSSKRLMAFLDYLDRHVQAERKWCSGWVAYHMKLEFGEQGLDCLSVFDWNEILGVPLTSTWDEIKTAYARLAEEYDPSYYSGDSKAKFEQLNFALQEARYELSRA